MIDILMDRFFCLLTVFVLTLLHCFPVKGQVFPVYNHFYNNQYVYNPAEAGNEPFTTFTVNHRQQWRGVEGAPVVSTFTFHTPFDLSKSAIGLNVRSFERGILTSNDILVTYAYRLHLDEESTVHFGLSGGVLNNTIDFEKVDDPDDPVLSQFEANNNIQPAANFGIKYQSATGINLGIALPKLFPAFPDSDNDGIQFSPFNDVILMAYYKRKVKGKIVNQRRRGVKRRVKLENAYAPLEFHVLYRYAAAGNSQLEAMLRLTMGDAFWFGGSYRLNYGPTFNLGLQFDRLSLGYAYETASNFEGQFLDGSHEMQLNLRIGKEKRLRKKRNILRSSLGTKRQEHKARFSSQNSQEVNQVSDDQANKKYYLVIKSFSDFNTADRYMSRLQEEEELNAKIYYEEAKKKYHVHIFETTKFKDANQERKNIEEQTKFRGVKVLIVDQKK